MIFQNPEVQNVKKTDFLTQHGISFLRLLHFLQIFAIFFCKLYFFSFYFISPLAYHSGQAGTQTRFYAKYLSMQRRNVYLVGATRYRVWLVNICKYIHNLHWRRVCRANNVRICTPILPP